MEVKNAFEEKRNLSGSSWHNLPKDILVEVMLRVPPYSQFCIRAACKDWWFMLTDHKLYTVSNKIPWMVTLYNSTPYFRLQFDLHHLTRDNEAYKFNEMNGCAWGEFDVLAIKHGWILCSNERLFHGMKKLFLLSPFRKRIISLPNLLESSSIKKVATLSPDPSLASCVLVAYRYESWINISMCSLHDTKWTTITQDSPYLDYFENLAGVVCIWPFFYIVTIFGTVVKCDTLGRCEFLASSPMILSESYRWNFHVLEDKGEMMLMRLHNSCLEGIQSPVFEFHNQESGFGFHKQKLEGEQYSCLFRFIWSENVWVPQARIGERTIFAGVTSFLVSELGDFKNMYERIYYIDRIGELKFFCLKDKRHCNCEADEPYYYKYFRTFIEQP